jgi:hypothetical protein
MGQYYKIVNLDKGQYLKPHNFGQGAKLLEFGSSGSGIMLGLAVLLADGNGRGGGDLNDDKLKPRLKKLVGSWAGDRIVVTGDYADAGRFEVKDKPTEENLYSFTDELEDISYDVVEVLCEDSLIARDILSDGFLASELRAEMIKRKVKIASEIDAGIRLGAQEKAVG